MIVKTIAANASIQTLTFLTGILTAHVLGAEGRGELALVLLYPQLLATFSLLGVDRAISVLAGRGELARPFDTICAAAFGLSLPVMAAAWACVALMVDDRRLAAHADLYVLYVPTLYFYVLAINYFSGTGDFGKYNRARILFYVLYPLLVVVLLASRVPNLTSFVVANLAGMYGAFIISLAFLLQTRRGQGAWSRDALWSDLKLLSRKTSIFVAPAGLGVVCAYLPQIVLSHLDDLRALGLFVVYLSYSRLVAVVANALNVRVFQLSISGNDMYFAGQFRKAFLVNLVFALLLYLAAPVAFILLYGRDFSADLASARVLLLSAIFFYLSELLNERFKGQSRVGPDITAQICYLAVTLIAAMLLVPAYGLPGMALSVVAGDAARLAVLVWMTIDSGGLRAGNLFRIQPADIRELGGRLTQGLR